MKIKGFNFLFNSFWSAIEDRIETNLSTIFAPGDPQNFYQKYKYTIEFLKRVEMIIDDADMIEEFHQNEKHRRFQTRWNLPVYFQIRYQEIASSLEKICEIDWNNMQQAPSATNQMQMKPLLKPSIALLSAGWMVFTSTSFSTSFLSWRSNLSPVLVIGCKKC